MRRRDHSYPVYAIGGVQDPLGWALHGVNVGWLERKGGEDGERDFALNKAHSGLPAGLLQDFHTPQGRFLSLTPWTTENTWVARHLAGTWVSQNTLGKMLHYPTLP